MVLAMKSSLWAISAVLISCQLVFAAPPKVAVIRVTDIYKELPQIKDAQEKVERAKEELLLEPRAEELRLRLDTLKQIQNKISQLRQRSLNDEARKLAKEFEIKRIETKSLQEDFEEFRNNRNLEINREMVTEMRKMLNKISTLAQSTARKKGFDMVIDSSGATNTGIPMVIYAKDAPDITDEVIAILQAEQQAAEQAANPEPEGNETVNPEPSDSAPE